MRDERLLVLLDAYLDGMLSLEEKKELEQLLLGSDAARREFWQRASLHGWTYAATKVVYSEAPAVKERREIRQSFDWWGAATWFFNWKRLLPITGVAIAAVAALLFFQRPPDDTADEMAEETPVAERTNTLAVLTHEAGVVWANGTNADLEVGALLEPGTLRLKSGVAQIQFHNGARVILEGPGELELISPLETRLNFGKLAARVPPPASGFKVLLRDVTVTDLGTEFGVNEPLLQPPQLHVFEGKVELSLPAESVPRVLTQGQGVEVRPDAPEPMPANRGLFVSENELARRESTELQARYSAWRHTSGSLDRDPAMLVHFNFESSQRADRHLANRASQPRKGTTGTVVNCDWVEGRWPGKKALEFKDAGDRVKLAVPGRYRSLTYLAWVRVDSLPNHNNAIALTERHKPGEVHWQLSQQGRLLLTVRQPSVTNQAAWERLSSRPVVTPDWLGRWIQIAAVYDGPGKTMSLYANGQLVGSKKVQNALELGLDGMELGNWARRAVDASNTRDFNGRMDEFTLLARPLSAAEIRRQYEAGKPYQTMMVSASPGTSSSSRPESR